MNAQTVFSRQAVTVLVLLSLAAVIVPVLNLATTPSSALHISDHLIPLFGKYLCFALLALSVDLVWGFCGILSLGHGAFFALGGYAMGMYMMRQVGPRGVYADPTLPDFMVFLNWKELPWFWQGFDHFPYAVLMMLVAPGTSRAHLRMVTTLESAARSGPLPWSSCRCTKSSCGRIHARFGKPRRKPRPMSTLRRTSRPTRHE